MRKSWVKFLKQINEFEKWSAGEFVNALKGFPVDYEVFRKRKDRARVKLIGSVKELLKEKGENDTDPKRG